MKRPVATALGHSQLGTKTAFVLGLTMVLALLAGVLEILYLGQQETVSLIEETALGLVMVGLAIVLILLVMLPGQYLDQLALAAFAAAILYIFAMLTGALFHAHDIGRSLHAVLWFHPAFIAVSLTQPTRIAQSACWLVIAMLTGTILYFAAANHIPITSSTALVNHLIIILSLGASASLLYSLSLYREAEGADRARIEVLQQSEIALQAEVKAKEQARAELENANAVVAAFLNNMSHELRTPLNAIIGFSELIHSEMFGAHVSEKYKEYSGDVLESGRQMLELINNLLYFSQLNTGKINMVPIRLNVQAILKDAVETASEHAAGKDIRIVMNVSEAAYLMADSAGILRVLGCLLDNAVKFSNSGDQIFVQAQRRADGACEISVRDQGVGIPEAELESILKPFRKGGLSVREAVPGAGMGLALARIVMDLHGGSVSIDSTQGAGTCVTLLFPARAFPHSAA